MSKPTVVVFPDLLKSHVDQYVRKDGTVVQAHDDKRVAAAPKPGEVGHHEHTQYGAYFRPGDKVKDNSGKTHEVAEHNGASVRTKGGEMFHPTKLKHAGESEPRLALPKKRAAAKPAPAKTGSAAPAVIKNVGSEKWPMNIKHSEKLAAKHDDGSTHHVGGFKAPDRDEHRNIVSGGDHTIQHDGKTFSFTGKSGKNTKSGEDSFEYSSGESGEHRAWVTRSGHLMND